MPPFHPLSKAAHGCVCGEGGRGQLRQQQHACGPRAGGSSSGRVPAPRSPPQPPGKRSPRSPHSPPRAEPGTKAAGAGRFWKVPPGAAPAGRERRAPAEAGAAPGRRSGPGGAR